MTEKEYIADLRAENWRLLTQCEIIKDIERHRVHEWYHGKLSALKEWARKQPQEICNAVFACLANGSPSVYESPEHSQMLSSLKHALEKAEKEIAALKNKEANLHLTTGQS
jgi:hypothetical protein